MSNSKQTDTTTIFVALDEEKQEEIIRELRQEEKEQRDTQSFRDELEYERRHPMGGW
jgi:acyl-CoA hydrolase